MADVNLFFVQVSLFVAILDIFIISSKEGGYFHVCILAHVHMCILAVAEKCMCKFTQKYKIKNLKYAFQFGFNCSCTATVLLCR